MLNDAQRAILKLYGEIPTVQDIPRAIAGLIPRVKQFKETYIKSPEGELFPEAVYKKPQEEQQQIYKDFFSNMIMGATSAPGSNRRASRAARRHGGSGATSHHGPQVAAGGPPPRRGLAAPVARPDLPSHRTDQRGSERQHVSAERRLRLRQRLVRAELQILR